MKLLMQEVVTRYLVELDEEDVQKALAKGVINPTTKPGDKAVLTRHDAEMAGIAFPNPVPDLPVILRAVCPHCHIDVTGIKPAGGVKVGEVTLCSSCDKPSRFDENLNLVKIEVEKLDPVSRSIVENIVEHTRKTAKRITDYFPKSDAN